MAAQPKEHKVTELLSTAQLEQFRERAARYDHENTFFSEDFEELRSAGYLIQAVPEELGGLGLSFSEAMHQQRRLAYYAPADALAINMHLYWTGLAADLWHAGDKSLEWLLREASDGEVFAAGHAESGNDMPVIQSTTLAERVDGGYCFTGRKHFGTLSPVWTRFGLHGLDNSDPENPRIVHAFMTRDAKGYRIEENWDVLGMRATQSHDTVLDAAFVPDRYVSRIVPSGLGGADSFVLGMFIWALGGFGNVYYGLARSAFDRVLESVRTKQPLGLTRSSAWHPEVQTGIAEMAVALDAVEAHLDRVAEDWTRGVDHGAMWGAKIIMAKYHAVEAAWRVVDQAFDLAGGFGIFRDSGWERLLRDARLGRLHPANKAFSRELIAKSYLELDVDVQPRWG